MDPIYLRDIWKSSSCLVVNTLLSITKANWLRLFIEIITLYVLLQSQDRPEYTVGKMQWSRMYVVTTALKTEIIRWSIPDIRLCHLSLVLRERESSTVRVTEKGLVYILYSRTTQKTANCGPLCSPWRLLEIQKKKISIVITNKNE